MRQGVYVSLQRGVGTPRAVHFAADNPVELTVGSGGAWRLALGDAVTPTETAEAQARLSFDGTHLKVHGSVGHVQVDGVAVIGETELRAPCQLRVGGVVLSCDVTPPSDGNYVEATTFRELGAHTRAVTKFSPVKSFATTLLGFRTPNSLRATADTNVEPNTASLMVQESAELDADALFASTRKLSPNDSAFARTRPESLAQVTPQQANPSAIRVGSNPTKVTAPTPAQHGPSSAELIGLPRARHLPITRNAIMVALACATAGALGWTAARWATPDTTTHVAGLAATAPSVVVTPTQAVAASGPDSTGRPSVPGLFIASPDSPDGGTGIGQEPTLAEPLSASKRLVEVEARAVDALASGKRELALSLYEQLQQMAPTFVVYAEVTQLLRDNQGIAASNP